MITVKHLCPSSLCCLCRSLTVAYGMLEHPSQPYAYLRNAVVALFSSASQPDWLELDNIDIPHRRTNAPPLMKLHVYQELLNTAPNTHACALANSTSLPHARDWLNGVPSAALGKTGSSLGIPLHSSPHPCAVCHSTAHKFGDHHVGCGEER